MYSGKIQRAMMMREENGTGPGPDDVPEVELHTMTLPVDLAAEGAIRKLAAAKAARKPRAPSKIAPGLLQALAKALGKPGATQEDVVAMLTALLMPPSPSGPVVNAKSAARLARAVANLTEGEVRKCTAAGVPIGTYAQLREGLSRAQAFDVALASLTKR